VSRNLEKVGTATVVKAYEDALVLAHVSSIGMGLSSLLNHAVLFSLRILDAAFGAELGYRKSWVAVGSF